MVKGRRCTHNFRSIDEIRVNHIDGNEDNNPADLSNYNMICNAANYDQWLEQQKVFDNQTARQSLYMCVSASENEGMHPEEQTEARSDKDLSTSQLEPEQKSKLESMHEVGPVGEVFASRPRDRPTGNEVKDEPNLTPTMRKNKQCEKPFNCWLDTGLLKGDSYSIEEWCNGGAKQFECSQESIWRYLKKRLDLPDCNPINGDLTLAPYHGKQIIIHKKKTE